MATSISGLRSRPTTSIPTAGKTRSSARKDVSLSPESTPSLASASSLSSMPSDELEQEEKKFDDPYPDFLWMTTEEPHRSRRMAILKAHPEIRQLMGPTPYTFPLVLAVLVTQFTLALALRSYHPFSLPFLLTAYIVGGTLNQNTFLAIHEITHNLAFKSLRANKILAITANLCIGVPYAMAFKGYHREHHKYLGEEGIDTDLPSRLEAIVLNNVAGKTFFATFQLLFYAIRPGFIRTQKPTVWHGINIATILFSDYLLVHFFGWKPLVYLLFSSLFAGSLHPCAAHFIAEHYLMNGPKNEAEGVEALAQETTSYYGWLNILCYNVGYHNEHHDFPSVPWTNLPKLREVAKEYYEPLPAHSSWPYVTYKFITDPSVGMWSRAKRDGHGIKIDEKVWNAAASSSSSASASSDVSEGESSEDEKLSTQMREAVERGYGSEPE